MSRGVFRLDTALPSRSATDIPFTSHSSGGLHVFRAFNNPTAARGTLEYDLHSPSSKYTRRWESWQDFESWRLEEQTTKAIQLKRAKVYDECANGSHQYRFVCSRKGTGGVKAYTKLQPDWNHKRETMRTDCGCILLVKTYPNAPTVLGNYQDQHNHELGNANLPFTQISKETREYIAGLLRLKVSPTHILHLVHQGIYNNDDLFDDDNDVPAGRNDFIQLRDIRRIEKGIETETVRLHPDDGQSTLRWVERLRSNGQLLGFKAKSDPPPPGSGLAPDVFSLMLQSKWQRKKFQQYGEHLLCIDATHNTTVYEHLNLTTLVVRDKHAHGIPVAFMLASSGTRETIAYFLRLNRQQSPLTIPRYIMTDFDYAQIGGCTDIYLAFILLCWWHVLHAWQQHLHIPSYPAVWELLKRWIRITDQDEFDKTWAKIKRDAPQDFVNYLIKTWMSDDVVKMWSGVYRKHRGIFEACDTNMLIEAWHHVLKGKFLHGKRNRRLDHLLHTLMNDVLAYYALKQRRQDLGFEGITIEVKKRQDIIKRSAAFTQADIQHLEDGKYRVVSKSDAARSYEVDIDTYTCTCLDFPLILFCKHICAVQTFFDEATPASSVPASDTDSADEDRHSGDSSLSRASSNSSHAAPSPPNLVAPKPRLLTQLAVKLETLAARLRRPRTRESDLPMLPQFDLALDSMLQATDTGTVLPSAQHVNPNVKSWNLTRAAMGVMPKIKTKRKATGDPAYGAGGSSGLKAKAAKKAKQMPAPTITTSTAPSQPQQPPLLQQYPPQYYAPQYAPQTYPGYPSPILRPLRQGHIRVSTLHITILAHLMY